MASSHNDTSHAAAKKPRGAIPLKWGVAGGVIAMIIAVAVFYGWLFGGSKSSNSASSQQTEITTSSRSSTTVQRASPPPSDEWQEHVTPTTGPDEPIRVKPGYTMKLLEPLDGNLVIECRYRGSSWRSMEDGGCNPLDTARFSSGNGAPQTYHIRFVPEVKE